ncbi:hypothetical protein JAAARDRAFT_31187 [Jaapia argillacea MUCL 33604]|uniref:Uncharacterized protein n=1 Tax=Jaapia argillacea MUCL 33604 TaxID=933084 RepID=A0A067Q6B4_9AGAM|nr:hypothetical protein JAAARDRAFT_31187 [Jaapia argillacea MUCL 33604]
MKLFYVLALLISTVCASPIAEPPEARWTTKYTGRIQIVPTNGHPLGFVYNFTNDVNGVSPNRASDVHVTFNYTHGTPFTMVATNFLKPEPYFQYLGASTGHEGTLIPKSADHNELGFHRQPAITPPYSTPAEWAMGRKYETSIWTLDGQSKKLTAQWVNPDHSKPTTHIVYDKKLNEVLFVGDLATYNRGTPGHHAIEVGLYFVSD